MSIEDAGNTFVSFAYTVTPQEFALQLGPLEYGSEARDCRRSGTRTES
jgi:hypothetical protein